MNDPPDGVLSLQAEEESLGEVLYIVHTDHVLGARLTQVTCQSSN